MSNARTDGPPVNDLGKSFCILPWIHLNATVDGVWSRCCFDATNDYDAYYQQPEEPEFKLMTDALGCVRYSRYAQANPDRVFDLTQAFNSPNLRRTRRIMLSGGRPRACTHCFEQEDLGVDSHRQRMNAYYSERIDIRSLVSQTEQDGFLDAVPIFLDIRFGNVCNLSCIMCSFPISSHWGINKRPQWTTASIDPYRNDEDLWLSLRSIASHLRYIYFAGGEPFLQPGHMRFLDLLIETGAASQIQVHYNSNLTVLPSGIFNKLAHFKSVIIAASCDGTGTVFESIRRGAKWHQFVRNLHEAKRHVEVWLDVSIQRDNVSHLAEVFDFAQAEGVKIRFENRVHYPRDLSVQSLSIEEKQQQTKELERLIGICNLRSMGKVARQLELLVVYMNSAQISE